MKKKRKRKEKKNLRIHNGVAHSGSVYSVTFEYHYISTVGE